MKCYNGIRVPDQPGLKPCGQCMQCRVNKGRQWTSRILMEWLSTNHRCFFLTFTYKDERLPTTIAADGVPIGTLRKKKFLQWVQNRQKDFGPFRYYAVGEYGDHFGRPHYHMAIFPTHDSQTPEVLDAWRKRQGWTDAIELDTGLARYLAGYATKRLTQADDPRLELNQEPEFRESSRRPPLGHEFVETLGRAYSSGRLASILEERGDVQRTFRLDGRVYPISDWALKRLREKTGVPVLERDRQKHPRYLDYFPIQEAECNPQKHQAMQVRQHAQKKSKARSKSSF